MQAKKRSLKTPTKSGKLKRSHIRTVVKALHIVPKSQGWVVTTTGDQRLTQEFPNKQDAVEFGQSIAKQNKSSLIVHGRDGKIRQVDPFPARDRNH